MAVYKVTSYRLYSEMNEYLVQAESAKEAEDIFVSDKILLRSHPVEFDEEKVVDIAVFGNHILDTQDKLFGPPCAP